MNDKKTRPVRMTGGMTKTSAAASGYWRSLQSRESPPDAQSWSEFDSGHPRPGMKDSVDEQTPNPVSRRRFFGIVGATAAVAGTSGCVRKPVENILPYSERPEDLIPGKPRYYATAFSVGGSVEGLTVENQDGRPTKIEGNPKHSGSQGATGLWAQASVVELYDPDRTRAPKHDGEWVADYAAVRNGLSDAMEAAQGSQGQGLALVIREPDSPTVRAQLGRFKVRFPQARIFVDDPMAPGNRTAAAELIAGEGARVRQSLQTAKVVFAADADPLATEADAVRLAREWSATRRVDSPDDTMSRLYVVEPHLTSTGILADNRLRVRASGVGDILIALARRLGERPAGDVSAAKALSKLATELPEITLDEPTTAFVKYLARDLAEAQGQAAVIVGERQPVWVHALSLFINAALGNDGAIAEHATLSWGTAPTTALGEGWAQSLTELAEALRGGAISTVVCVEANPAYDAPGALGMAALLEKATVIHFGLYEDETAKLATWHVPVSHYLEAWGDLEASDGTVTIQQPLIEPLHTTYSVAELLGFLATGKLVDGYSLVKGHWIGAMGPSFSDRSWRRALHDGVVSGVPRPVLLPSERAWPKVTEAVAAGRRPVPEGQLEVNLHLSPKLGDGRYATSAWLQELPHPVTKLVWDNAAMMSSTTAAALGVGDRDLVTVTVDGRSIELPAWIAPGQADDTVSIAVGYGRDVTEVTRGAGVDAFALQGAVGQWFAAGTVARAGGTYDLVSTQDHGTMKPHSHLGIDFPERPIVQEATRSEFRKDPKFVDKANLMPAKRLRHLWDPPKYVGKQQWGMSIDLNTCTGCNACVVACQAENNIPVVGKAQVAVGRELHWMRIDRYFRGDADNPTAVLQPMLCQQCESAPCETVCPVAATVHSPEGLNDMTYNRCIGTRYCSNNCPYKVRRFNYFNFNLDLRPERHPDDPDGARLRQMQKNPDVTIRFRGVMEKCTYCTQRISQAKIAAHVAGKDKVEDGVIVTACEQVCPTQSIIFGDIRDPNSRVTRAKRQTRDYSVLSDLNTQPRTTYLARIRNPNPELLADERRKRG